jgi:hypothetical protein
MKPLEEIELKKFGHNSPDEGMCVMEAVAYIAGEPHSDQPQCACPALGTFLRSWNDALDDATRQRLKPYIPRIIGTNDGRSEERRYMILDWLERVYTPAWLDLVPELREHAAILRALPVVVDTETLVANQDKLDAAGNAARNAARNAAWNAAQNAAWNAAWNAARKRNAAWNAAWNAAGADLAPTVAALQSSAFDLLDRLVEKGTQ